MSKSSLATITSQAQSSIFRSEEELSYWIQHFRGEVLIAGLTSRCFSLYSVSKEAVEIFLIQRTVASHQTFHTMGFLICLFLWRSCWEWCKNGPKINRFEMDANIRILVQFSRDKKTNWFVREIWCHLVWQSVSNGQFQRLWQTWKGWPAPPHGCSSLSPGDSVLIVSHHQD